MQLPPDGVEALRPPLPTGTGAEYPRREDQEATAGAAHVPAAAGEAAWGERGDGIQLGNQQGRTQDLPVAATDRISGFLSVPGRRYIVQPDQKIPLSARIDARSTRSIGWGGWHDSMRMGKGGESALA